jgi:hypothetical protein
MKLCGLISCFVSKLHCVNLAKVVEQRGLEEARMQFKFTTAYYQANECTIPNNINLYLRVV